MFTDIGTERDVTGTRTETPNGMDVQSKRLRRLTSDIRKKDGKDFVDGVHDFAILAALLLASLSRGNSSSTLSISQSARTE